MKELAHPIHIRFIINPISGKGERLKTQINDLAPKILDSKRFNIEIVYTEYAGHATLLSKEAAEQGIDIVVACGGDGSINETAAGLAHSNTTLAIIPLGSGNGLARHLGLPLSIEKALSVINNLNTTQIDTVTLNNRRYLSLAGVGFDAQVAYRYDQTPSRGFQTYFKIAVEEYFQYQPQQYTLRYNQEERTTEALLITVANSNQFGYNTVIAPRASLTDGLLEVVVMQKVPWYMAPAVGHMLFHKKIDQSRYVEVIRTSELTIIQPGDIPVNLDGESVNLGKELHFKINHQAQKIIIP